MARRSNSSGGSGGCIVLLIILGLVSYVAIELLTFFAIVGVIYLVIRVFSNDSASPAATSDSDSGTSGRRLPISQTAKNITEKPVPTNRDTEIIESFTSKYRIAPIPFPPAQTDPLATELRSFQCTEVLQSVNRLLNRRVNAIKQLNQYRKQIDSILLCPNCSDNEQKVQYLQEHEPELKRILDECSLIKSQMNTQKITLMNKHNGAFSSLQNAVSLIMNSQKVVGTAGVEFNTFAKVKSSIPGDMFTSMVPPVKLNFGAYRFFLLPEVILVYDKENAFVTALEPAAMIFNGRAKQKSVNMSKVGYPGTWRHSDPLIAADSVMLSEGTVRTSWLHTKKDGGPDRRYSHNPMYQNRTDLYKYGEITIQIGQYKAEYSFSAGNIAEKINIQVREYTSIMHELNATPSLLRLLESAAKKKTNAHDLCVKYQQSNVNCICKGE